MSTYSVRDGRFFEDDILTMEAYDFYEVITYLKTNYPWLEGKEVVIENVADNDDINIIVL